MLPTKMEECLFHLKNVALKGKSTKFESSEKTEVFAACASVKKKRKRGKHKAAFILSHTPFFAFLKLSFLTFQH